MALAHLTDGAVEVVHVVAVAPSVGMAEGIPLYVNDQSLREQAEARLNTWLEGIAGGELLARRVIIGEASREIVELATRERFDVIVMGTHGRTGLAHAFLGSVAERVVRRAGCPVLTVREAPPGEARVAEPARP